MLIEQNTLGISQEAVIRFVDWDLPGQNYRAYDLAKPNTSKVSFRTNPQQNSLAKTDETYASEVNKVTRMNEPWLHPDLLESNSGYASKDLARFSFVWPPMRPRVTSRSGTS